jgi:hypothetical protein
MRLLRINNTDVHIDDDTAIGIDFQSYNVSEPGKRFVNISNTFTIPLTSHNLSIFGNADDPQSLDETIYNVASCDYWVDNEQLINNAKCRVEEIGERISLFIFQKADIWDILKGVSWYDFIVGFCDWADNVKGLPGYSGTNPITNKNVFASTFANNTEYAVLPHFVGNFYHFDPQGTGNDLDFLDPNNPTVNRIYLNYSDLVNYPFGNGGHFCIYVKSIFEYIEYAYDVNFLTSGGVLPGNIWDDPVENKLYVLARELLCNFIGNPVVSIWIEPDIYRNFYPFTDLRDKADKTLYDFANAFFQHLNIIIDELEVDGEDVIRLARFDDIETIAEVVDWSGKISGKPNFKPKIDDINQYNYIKFSEIYPEGDSMLNSKTLTCENYNIDYKKDLFSIDAYVNSVIYRGRAGEFIPDLSNKESFKTFIFYISDSKTSDQISINIYKSAYGGGQGIGPEYLFIPELYSLDDEYNFYDEIITKPKIYEIKKWLTFEDIKNFEFFKQYFIRELNGSFFVNKISGFNPDKSKEPTTIELIKISDRTPAANPDLEFWADGVADGFTDGESDIYF